MRNCTENIVCHGCKQMIYTGHPVMYSRRGPLAGKRHHPQCYPKNNSPFRDSNVEFEDHSEEPKHEFYDSGDTDEDRGIATKTTLDETKKESKPVTNNPLSDAIVDAIWPSIANLVDAAKTTASSDSTAAVEIAREYTDDRHRAAKNYTDDCVSIAFREFKPESTRIEFSIPGLPDITVSTPHPQLTKLVKALQLEMIPYLYGQAGSGKTHAALDAARILGYQDNETYVVTCNPFSSPIELIGYTDAHGKQVDKAFIRAFRDGGFIVLDEADRSRPDFLPALNSALANKQLVSPDGTIVRQHERFALVLTGNTPMHGQSKQYNSASRQDASVIDRLFYIEWVIDEKMETRLGLAISEDSNDLIKWAQAIRKAAAPKQGAQAEVNVTMRGVLSLVKANKYSDGMFNLPEIKNATIFKGIGKETIDRLEHEVRYGY